MEDEESERRTVSMELGGLENLLARCYEVLNVQMC